MHSYKPTKQATKEPLLVLILVVMEDALVQSYKAGYKRAIVSLNPCFNGRCTRTRKGINLLAAQFNGS